MSRRCPACDLPLRELGQVIAASSNDRQVHGVLGVCLPCQARARRLPLSTRMKLYDRAADRALASPDRYLCTLYPTAATARLAHGLLLQQDLTVQVMRVMGWLEQEQAAQD